MWNKIVHPPIAILVADYILCALLIATAALLTVKGIYDIGAYIAFALAAVALVYLVYLLVYGIPKIKNRVVEVAERYEFTYSLTQNYGFRTLVFSCFSFGFNIIYVLYNGAVAIYYMSLWYAILAAYYFALGLIRASIIFGSGNRKRLAGMNEGERQITIHSGYLRCGVWLILLSVMIVTVIVRMNIMNLNDDRSFVLIYIVAIYTVIRMYLAIRNIFKARKSMDPTTQSLRNINLAGALVSLLAFQTAMIAEFGTGDAIFMRIMNGVTGVLVCLIIIALGVVMVVRGARAISKVKHGTEISQG
jgi:hypothetical protein